jgi:hypothetical protein
MSLWFSLNPLPSPEFLREAPGTAWSIGWPGLAIPQRGAAVVHAGGDGVALRLRRTLAHPWEFMARPERASGPLATWAGGPVVAVPAAVVLRRCCRGGERR